MKSIVIMTCKHDCKLEYYVKENHDCRMLMDCFLKNNIPCLLIDLNITKVIPNDIDEYSDFIFWTTCNNINETLEIFDVFENKKHICILWFETKNMYLRLYDKYKLGNYQVIIGQHYSAIVSYVANSKIDNEMYFEEKAENIVRCKQTVLNTYLHEVILNGGLCEIIEGGQCNKCEDCFLHLSNSRNRISYAELLGEIILLKECFHMRKISIISSNFLASDTNVRHLFENEYVQGVQFSICCCYKDIEQYFCFIKENEKYLYNIDLYIDLYDKRKKAVFDLLALLNTRVKIHFVMFNNNCSLKQLKENLDFLQSGKVKYAPDCLFMKEGNLEPSLQKVYEVWNIIYRRIFFSEFIKLVCLENELKLPYRTGQNVNFIELDEINNRISQLADKQNILMLEILRTVICREKDSDTIGSLLNNILQEERENIIAFLSIV